MMPGARMTEAEFAERAAKPKKKPAAFKLKSVQPKEADVLSMVKRALKIHPAVAWFERTNSAAGCLLYPNGKKSQFMRFGFVGQPDIIGQLKDGRFLGVEVKGPSGRVAPEQQAFMDKANKHGAVVFVARSVADVFAVLDGIQRGQNGVANA